MKVKCAKADEKCGDCHHAKPHEWSTVEVCVSQKCVKFAYHDEEANVVRGEQIGAYCEEI